MAMPQLKHKIKKTTLKIPDTEKDLEIIKLLKMIGVILEKTKQKPEDRLTRLKKYLPFLEATPPSLILELKKRSYEINQSHSDPDSVDKNEEGATTT